MVDGEKPLAKKNMLSYLQDVVPEFESFNHLSLAMFLTQAEIIDLTSSPSLGRSSPRMQKEMQIDDSSQLGFYLVL